MSGFELSALPARTLTSVIPFLAWPSVKPAMVAGETHTCVLKADGEMVCFGRNYDGQCDVPPDLGPVKVVAAGGFPHMCGEG